MTLVEGTAAYAEWLESSVPSYTKMYLFSVQNPDDILAEEAKPDLKEMGPYTFRYCIYNSGLMPLILIVLFAWDHKPTLYLNNS